MLAGKKGKEKTQCCFRERRRKSCANPPFFLWKFRFCVLGQKGWDISFFFFFHSK